MAFPDLTRPIFSGVDPPRVGPRRTVVRLRRRRTPRSRTRSLKSKAASARLSTTRSPARSRSSASRLRSPRSWPRSPSSGRSSIVRLPADVRAGQLGAIMETIADLADEVDRERDHIPRPVDVPVTLLEYGDYECPCAPPRPPSVPPHRARLLGHARPAARPPGRTRAPRTRRANAAQLDLDADQLSEGLRGRRFAARVAEYVPSPRRERRHGQADLLHQPPSLRCPRSEDAESPSRLSTTLACPPASWNPRPPADPPTKMGTARADTGSAPRDHARHGLRTQSSKVASYERGGVPTQ